MPITNMLATLTLLMIGVALVSGHCDDDTMDGTGCMLDCEHQWIECSYRFTSSGQKDLDIGLAMLSRTLNQSEKNMNSFDINGWFQKVLKDHTVADLTFASSIEVRDTDLVHIEQDAFKGTELVTKALYFDMNRVIDHSVLDIIRKFRNIETLSLSDSNQSSLPMDLFDNLAHLKDLTIIEPISEYQTGFFSKLNKLEHLQLGNWQAFERIVTKFDDHVFYTGQKSDVTLHISLDLGYQPKFEDYFTDKSLLNVQRPVNLTLHDAATLPEHIFSPFLDENPTNVINIGDRYSFECKDPINAWIINQPKIAKRVNFKCL